VKCSRSRRSLPANLGAFDSVETRTKPAS
jgi:hypothetical protein